MNKNLLITSLVVLVVAGGVGFYGGMKYQQSKVPTRQFGNFAGRTGGGRVIFLTPSCGPSASRSTSSSIRLPVGSALMNRTPW